ncbi:MAG TPA: anhydro-N-acetylmuramic acid kinase [Bryobacteraceae bacterium]|nr:anhydro-N-acetylmuramic acid kinase [Bryobacteraceae bacterium]
MRVAGIMSGTSLDGIDVAIVDIHGRGIETLAHASFPYSPRLRAAILAVSNTQCSTRDISRLNFELGARYAKAVSDTCRRHNVPLQSVELIGCHGQTVYHEGAHARRNTLQIGEASVIAEQLGIPVVSDFRTRDIAAGGQGAPLVPLVDYLLFRSATRSRVALNIGGIANITVLPKNAKPEQVIAFDTGPGNMVIDQLISLLSKGRQTFDRNGRIAAENHCDSALLNKLLRHPYYRVHPPKTAGREQYGHEFIETLLSAGLPVPDLVATATVFTAATIAAGIQRFAPGTQEVIAAGGGVHNSQLMVQLEAFLPGCRLTTTAEFKVNPDAKEAIAFAVLAHRTWKRQTGNLPSATGASHAVVLGKVTFGTR